MKKCVLLVLLLFAVVPASGQESGNRIYGNNGYYQQQQRHLQIGAGSLGPSDSYAIEANVLTNLKPDAFVCMAAYGDYGTGYIGTAEAYTQGGYETSFTVPVSRVSPRVESVLTDAMHDLLQ